MEAVTKWANSLTESQLQSKWESFNGRRQIEDYYDIEDLFFHERHKDNLIKEMIKDVMC